ncbi:MAG: hypothetical protein PHV82_08620 [Victivallaceae bacterium]|nr:hypothetical protein [Victivallaceae bacterium]
MEQLKMENSSTNGQYILVRSKQPENKYGAFLQELLVSEGFMGFEIIDIDIEPIPRFKPCDIIIVTRCYLKDAEFALIKEAVNLGASAVIIQPQSRFVIQSGWKAENLVFHPGYIKIDENYPGAGLPIQTHLPIPLYSETENAKNWNIIAKALDCSWSENEYPAVVSCKYGAGKWVFFFYDLPQAVARIRFGNPDLAGYCTVGLPWPHTFDLFAGHIDERLKHVPQSDFHCQMLAKILTEISPYLLPGFWYYEKIEYTTACIIQSDDDYSKPEDFEDLAETVEKHGGLSGAQLVRLASSYGYGHARVAVHDQAKGYFPRGCSVIDLSQYPRNAGVLLAAKSGLRRRCATTHNPTPLSPCKYGI